MTRPDHGPRTPIQAGRPVGLLALLVLLDGGSMRRAVRRRQGADGRGAFHRSDHHAAARGGIGNQHSAEQVHGCPGRAPKPIRVLHQGDRVFGVYWVAASLEQLAPVERRLRALGLPASSGELDCDRGARRWLEAPVTISSRVAVYFGTERDARAFAEGIDVRPRPNGHAAAILYCLD